MNVREKIELLVRDRTVDQELYDLVARLAGAHLRKLDEQAQEEHTPESLAGDFIVHLFTEGVGCEIGTPGDIRRELSRWFVQRQAPQDMELWEVVSAALLELERAGKVKRGEEYRNFFNSNQTQWYLPENEGKPCDWPGLDAKKLKLPKFSAKGEFDRLLKPEEARECVMAVLRAGAGEVPMAGILGELRNRVPMMRMGPSLDDPVSEDAESGEAQEGLHEVVESTQILHMHSLLLEEDGAYLAANIWDEAGEVEKGRTTVVSGQHILCCYYLPKKLFDQKIKLDEFGPSSTVQEVVDELEEILREWLPSPVRKAKGQAMEDWQFQELTRQIIGRLGTFCSENGHCVAFYSSMGQ